MPISWKEAVWQAVKRRGRLAGTVSREDLIGHELAQIVSDTGSIGKTPSQTLSRELQELRDAGVLIFDGRGNYRMASTLASLDVDIAIVTEARRMQSIRLGQSGFRKALDRRWQRCPLTGITERGLLRASHIVPWNRCEREQERIDPENGLLLSALWDAAFDKGLVSFDDDGRALMARAIEPHAEAALRAAGQLTVVPLSFDNLAYLHRHRMLHIHHQHVRA